jgi:hypothetical protein
MIPDKISEPSAPNWAGRSTTRMKTERQKVHWCGAGLVISSAKVRSGIRKRL